MMVRPGPHARRTITELSYTTDYIDDVGLKSSIIAQS